MLVATSLASECIPRVQNVVGFKPVLFFLFLVGLCVVELSSICRHLEVSMSVRY